MKHSKLWLTRYFFDCTSLYRTKQLISISSSVHPLSTLIPPAVVIPALFTPYSCTLFTPLALHSPGLLRLQPVDEFIPLDKDVPVGQIQPGATKVQAGLPLLLPRLPSAPVLAPHTRLPARGLHTIGLMSSSPLYFSYTHVS